MTKENTLKPDHRLTVRFNKNELAKLENWLKKSTYHRNMSELIRHLLFKKEITLNTYDASLDRLYEELVLVKKELNAIGVNINQVTHYFNADPDPSQKLIYAEKIAPLYEGTTQKIEKLFDLLSELAQRWSLE